MSKGSKENIVRTFINRNVERHLVKEFLLHETQDAGFGGLTFKRTPEGEMIVLGPDEEFDFPLDASVE